MLYLSQISVAITLLVNLILYFLFMKKVGLKNLHSPAVMFFYNTIIFLYSGLFVPYFVSLIFNLDQVLTISEGSLYILIASIWSFIFGVLLSKFNQRNSKSEKTIINKFERDKSRYKIIFYMCISISLLFYLIYFLQIGEIPLFARDAENFRVISRVGNGKYLAIAYSTAAYSAIILPYLLKSKLTFDARFYIIMIIGLLGYLSGNRTPMVLVYLGLLISLYQNNYPIKIVNIFLILGLGFISIGVTQIIRTGNFALTSFVEIILNSSWRSYALIFNWSFIYDSFTKYQDLLYGYSYLVDIRVLLPQYSDNFGTWLKYYLGFDYAGGSFPPTFIGESFINWGTYPSLIISFIYGYYLQKLYYVFNKKKTVSSNIILAILSISLATISGNGIIIPLLYILLPMLLIHFFSNIFTKFNINYGKPNYSIQ